MGLLPRDDDAQLADLWLKHFGTPMPVYGAPALARRILLEHGVEVPQLAAPALQQKKVSTRLARLQAPDDPGHVSRCERGWKPS
jgi:hypothetical protein